MAKANYAVIAAREKVVLLADLGPHDKHKTITNDAERVVRDVYLEQDLGNRKLFYIDSDGDMCQLVHDAGVFVGFRPL